MTPASRSAFIRLTSSCLGFASVTSPVALLLERGVQGVGVALTVSTLGVCTTELQPVRMSGVCALLNAAGPAADLAISPLGLEVADTQESALGILRG